MTIITTGDAPKIPVTLKRDGATFVIGGGAVIKAVLTTLDRTTIISAEVTINNTATGTDLSASKFVVEFTKAETAAILIAELLSDSGHAILEVQVDETGSDPETWTDGVIVRKGNIA